jgi:PPE-repeat protein
MLLFLCIACIPIKRQVMPSFHVMPTAQTASAKIIAFAVVDLSLEKSSVSFQQPRAKFEHYAMTVAANRALDVFLSLTLGLQNYLRLARP